MATDVSAVKYRFFDMAIADIIRAIRGESLMGAFTLSMCAIDAMAYLRDALPSQGSGENFTHWAEEWMVPLNGSCRPDVLWALRCGLVHTYGYSRAMEKCGIKGYWYVHDKRTEHWTRPQPNTYVLNLDSHVAELAVAAFGFFDCLAKMTADDAAFAQDVQGRMKQLSSVQYFYQSPVVESRRRVIPAAVILPAKDFKDMDAALAPLGEDVKEPVAPIEANIQSIYPQRRIAGQSA